MRISTDRPVRDCGDIEPHQQVPPPDVCVYGCDLSVPSVSARCEPHLAVLAERLRPLIEEEPRLHSARHGSWALTRCGDIALVTGQVCVREVGHGGEHSDGAEVWPADDGMQPRPILDPNLDAKLDAAFGPADGGAR
jgi:hypothetical protein